MRTLKEEIKEIYRQTAEIREKLFDDELDEDKIYELFKEYEQNILFLICNHYEKRLGINITQRESVDIDIFFFNKDGKTIKDRIKEIKEDNNFLYRMKILQDTELYNCINCISSSVIKYYKLPSIVVVDVGGCESCVGIGSGEFLEDDIPEPPFHPGCKCYSDIEYEILPDLTDEEYVVMLEELIDV